MRTAIDYNDIVKEELEKIGIKKTIFENFYKKHYDIKTGMDVIKYKETNLFNLNHIKMQCNEHVYHYYLERFSEVSEFVAIKILKAFQKNFNDIRKELDDYKEK